MTEPGAEVAKARSLGLKLLNASRIYEDFLIPRLEGHLWWRRRFPPHRRAIIGLVARQRRFLRAVYTLADAGQVLEAVGPLRSMLEFLIFQQWLALDPERNWQLWMDDDHAARDQWRKKLQENAPTLHDAAVAALTPEQRKEAEEVAAGRKQLAAELGVRQSNERRITIEQRASQVGLTFLYDGLYRYESNAAVHPSMLATELLMERRPKGLLLRREPTTQFAAPPVYLQGASLLYEALQGSGELTPALNLPELPSLGTDLHALAVEQMNTRLSNWREVLPPEVVDQF
jgi:Family of unknown function (DUF5677)